jgi:hypothetical protein
VKCIKLYEHCSLVEVDLKRDFFTKHGLHLNGRGKDVIMKQPVCQIHGRFFKVASTPIGFVWKIDFSNQDLEDNSSPDEMEKCGEVLSQIVLNLDPSSHNCVLNLTKSVANRSSNRVRRVPITRDRYFLL